MAWEHDAAVALRTCFEVRINLRACATIDGFSRRYLDSDLIRRRKLCTARLKLTNVSAEERARAKTLFSELSERIKQTKATEIKVEALATEVGMADDYNTLYRLTSPSVHAAPRVLHDFARVQGGKLEELVFGISDKYARIHFFSLTEYLLLSTADFAVLVGVDRIRKWNRLRANLNRLEPAWPEPEDSG